MTPSKICKKCKIEKNIQEFISNNSNNCKKCKHLYRAQYRQNNKEKIRQNNIDYAAKNKEYLKIKRSVYKNNNKEKIKKYYVENKERINNKKKNIAKITRKK